MGGMVLAAIFLFSALVALLAAERTALGASAALVVGAGWPATLFDPVRGIVVGTGILLAGLALLAGLGSRRVPAVVLPAAAAVAVAALGIGSATAARRPLVGWQAWDPTGGAATPVSVGFVWDAQYGGLDWPRRRTVVLQVQSDRQPRYLRVGVLDDFAIDAWRSGVARSADALEPAAAAEPRNQTREDVTVEALAGTQLAGGSIPVRFSGGGAPLVVPARGFAALPSGLTRDFHYTVWSYSPRTTPAALERSPADYPAALSQQGLLSVGDGAVVPAFGEAGRQARLSQILTLHPSLYPYLPLAKVAQQVVGAARTPYDAVAALEQWFREDGGFRYSDHPRVVNPPLVGFVTDTRAGYCQYFAGAMALMLRYIGIPARVAVGFSGGSYDAGKHAWLVTDHDAHAWVEVWFKGYGWLPFDPTPPVPGSSTFSPASAAAGGASPGGPGLAGPTVTVPGGANPVSALGSRLPSLDREQLRRPGDGFVPGRVGGSSTLLVAIVLLGVLAALVAGGAALKLARRIVRGRERDPRRVAVGCRDELAAFLVDQGVVAARGATLQELGELTRRSLGGEPQPFVAAATAARFGPPARAGAAATQARRELRVLIRELRRRLTARERVLGWLSPRSLLPPRGAVDVSGSLGRAGS
jgi:hypothetical protein